MTATQAPDHDADANPHRLPRTVLPRRYDLVLEPDLATASFAGSVTIAAEAVEATDRVVLHAADLEIASAAVAGTPAEVHLDAEFERLVLDLPAAVEPGPVDIELTFTGVLNDQLRGFYRSTYTDDDGVEHTIATTQFESTNARRAFPCFDEPDMKAVFGVRLVVADGLEAVSCGPETGRETRPDGRVAITYGDTMLMSTYLVAFVVGELEFTETVDAGGTPMRIVHVPGKGHLARWALDYGAAALTWLADYYDIPYPGEKLDMVAVPDFAFGAMENLGCVVYRETLLLVDPAQATQPELTRIADVISHELAHMWFGDLVTMTWWEGIWLKEAFATFMEIMCVDALRPEWKRWEQFGRERSAAFDVDALGSTRAIEYPVLSPADAEGMYDILTYEKGAAVVRMLEQYLTPERFRGGVHHYLTRHSYANTRTTDLWDALEDHSGDPVRRTMDTWIFQGGHPVVAVSATDDGVRVDQQRFLYLADPADQRRWGVPVMVRARVGGDVVERRELLDDDGLDVDLGGRPDWVVVNAGAHGFYRVRYEADLLAALRGEAQEVLSAPERYALVDDTWASVLAGETDAAAFVELAEAFASEDDLGVWQVLLDGLRGIDRILDGDARAALRRRVAVICSGPLGVLGYEAIDGESGLDRELRGVLLKASAQLGDDPDSTARALALFDAYLADPATVEPNLAAAAVSVAAANGDADTYEVFLDRYRNAATPQEEQRFLYALAEFPGGPEMDRTLVAARDEFRNQSAPFVFLLSMANRDHGERVWRFMREHWAALVERMPGNLIPRMLTGLRTLNTPALAADVEAFFAEHPPEHGKLTIAQYLEKMRVNVALREREAERLGDALA